MVGSRDGSQVSADHLYKSGIGHEIATRQENAFSFFSLSASTVYKFMQFVNVTKPFFPGENKLPVSGDAATRSFAVIGKIYPGLYCIRRLQVSVASKLLPYLYQHVRAMDSWAAFKAARSDTATAICVTANDSSPGIRTRNEAPHSGIGVKQDPFGQGALESEDTKIP
ncbi:MAG: hypothetical protein V4634_08550 [Pseudomonadota bacterium]